LTVIEQKAEQSSGETGSLNAGSAAPNSSEAQREQMAASVPEISVVESPRIAPDHEAPRADAPKVEVTKIEVTKVEAIKAPAPQAEASRVEAPKVEAPRAEAPKLEAAKAGAPRSPAKFMLMPAGNRNWHGAGAGSEMKSEPSQRPFGGRRLSAMAAVVVLAVMAGALGGALTAANLPHFAGEAVTGGAALEAAVARIDADILALKASVEHTSQLSLAQYNKTTDHLDKVEKAQAEPLAKLARLSEAVDKLRAAAVAPAPVAAVPAAAKEVTGSIAPPAPAPAAAPKVEVARLPTVEGWRLLDIANGSALIEGRRGMFEVYAGDPVPGLGKVEAIRKQDGHWVVVTSKGLIVGR
jgi:hypothetical protein